MCNSSVHRLPIISQVVSLFTLPNRRLTDVPLGLQMVLHKQQYQQREPSAPFYRHLFFVLDSNNILGGYGVYFILTAISFFALLLAAQLPEKTWAATKDAIEHSSH